MTCLSRAVLGVVSAVLLVGGSQAAINLDHKVNWASDAITTVRSATKKIYLRAHTIKNPELLRALALGASHGIDVQVLIDPEIEQRVDNDGMSYLRNRGVKVWVAAKDTDRAFVMADNRRVAILAMDSSDSLGRYDAAWHRERARAHPFLRLPFLAWVLNAQVCHE